MYLSDFEHFENGRHGRLGNADVLRSGMLTPVEEHPPSVGMVNWLPCQIHLVLILTLLRSY